MITHTPKNILVTGGCGFIGSNFVNYMLNTYDDINIINIDSLTYAAKPVATVNWAGCGRYSHLNLDINEDIKFKAAPGKQYAFDTVVHFAAESHVDRSIADPLLFMRTNVMGTAKILELAKEHWTVDGVVDQNCRFHHISTDEVYGSLGLGDRPFTEATPYAPRSPYSASKAAADHLVRAYHETYGLPVTISNCSNNYGPWQDQEKFIPTIIRKCLEEKPIPVYGNGQNVRDWLHVKDHCRAVDTILRRGQNGQTYNIGGNNERTNLELVDNICTAVWLSKYGKVGFNYQSLVTFVTDRQGHDFRYAIDNSKIKNELGWEPEVTAFSYALRMLVDWYGDRI